MPKPPEKGETTKAICCLPDLEQTKSAVLNSLTSKSGQRTYDHAINEFVDWYCSEPRLAFNRTVVLRSTWNSGTSLPQRSTSATGRWHPPSQGRTPNRCEIGQLAYRRSGAPVLLNSHGDNLRSKRNYAILAFLIGRGLRRGELLARSVASIRLREEHWVIADLYGKAGHIRTVPIPLWVKGGLDRWTEASGIKDGCLFRASTSRDRSGATA